MAPYRYESFQPRFVGSIAEMMARSGDIRARATLQAADARANATLQSGQAWGNAIGTIGQAVASIPGQMQAAKAQEQNAQIRTLQLEQERAQAAAQQRQQADVSAMDQAFSPQAALGPGGQGPMAEGAPMPDRQTILSSLPGHLQPVAIKHFQEIDDAKKKDRETRNDYWASLAAGVHAFGNDPQAALFAIQEAAEDYPEQARQMAELIQQHPDPTYIGQLTQSLMVKSPKYAEQLRKSEPKPAEPYTLGPGQTRYGPNGEVLASVPAAEKPEPNVTETQLAVMAARGDRQAEAALNRLRDLRKPQGGQSNDEPVVVVMGPDGKPVYVPRSQAVGKQPATGSLKPASGVEKKALGFFNRADQADKELEALEADIGKMGLGSQTYMQYAPNFLQSQTGQSYTAAQRAFTEARLRKDSGAAIPPQEFENDRQTYFVQPGDSPETQAQKRRARAAMLASLAFESGQALGEYVGDPEEAKRLIDGFKARSARPDAAAKPPAAPAGGDRVRVVGPNGQTGTVPKGTSLPAGWKLAS